MTLPQLDSKGHSKVNQIYQLTVSNGDLYLNSEYSDSIGFYFVTDRGLVALAVSVVVHLLPEPAAALAASVPALEVATAPSSASTTSAKEAKESYCV